MAIKRLAFYSLTLQLNIRRSVVKESILYLNMEEKLVRVNWKRGQYSDVGRVDVVILPVESRPESNSHLGRKGKRVLCDHR